MLNIRNLATIVLLLVLSGCAGSPNYITPTELQKQNKGVVVTQHRFLIRNPLSFALGPLKYPLENAWRNIDLPADHPTPNRTLGQGWGTTRERAYILDRGVYTLHSLFAEDLRLTGAGLISALVTNHKGKYSLQLSNFDQRVTKGYTTFKLEAGEVIYIGDINAYPGPQSLLLKVEDKFKNAKKYMNKFNPNLVSSMSKRLVRVEESLAHR